MAAAWGACSTNTPDLVDGRIGKTDSAIATIDARVAPIDGTATHIDARVALIDGMTVDAAPAIDAIVPLDDAASTPDAVPRVSGVTTLAGNGRVGADGTGGADGTAEFVTPSAIAIDAAGNLYIADTSGQCIRKIDPDGNVTTLAGNGTYGYVDGTGGADGTAEFFGPSGVAVDSAGNVYVADEYNNAIRVIDPDGNVTTLSGNGTAGFVDGTGGAQGSTEFNNPSAVALDSMGNLYVADLFNQRIRMVDASGNTTTIAGNGTSGLVNGVSSHAEFSFPDGIAFDSAGDIFVADGSNNQIREIDVNGNVTTLAGQKQSGFADGNGGQASFYQPVGLAIDESNNVYVADSDNSRLRKIDSSGNVTTLSGNGTGGYADGTGGANGIAEFSGPRGVVLDGSGGLYVADGGNSRVRRIDSSGNASTFAGNGFQSYVDGTGGANGTTEFNYPYSLTVDGAGNVYVVDTNNNNIRKIDLDGNTTTVAGNGLYGDVDGSGGAGGTAEFNQPWGDAVDTSGNIYVADYGNNCIRKIDVQGNVTTIAGNGTGGFVDGSGGSQGTAEFSGPAGVVVDSAGNLYVTDSNNNSVRKIDIDGNVTTLAGNGNSGFIDGTGGMNGTAEFSYPVGIAIDSNGILYVGDGNNYSVRKIDSHGNVTTLAGNGNDGDIDGTGGMNGTAEFTYPSGVAADSSGNVYVADYSEGAVRAIDSDGNVTTLAGNGTSGFVDGTLGRNGTAEFREIRGVATDRAGNVYVADWGNSRIRKVVP